MAADDGTSDDTAGRDTEADREQPREEPAREPEADEPPERRGALRFLGTWAAKAVGLFVVVLGVASGLVGLSGDFPDFWRSLPFVDPPPLAGDVNIVVAPLALDTPQPTDRDERTARRFGEALLAMAEDELARPARVAVGAAADGGVRVYRTEAGRAERLRADLASRSGHIAISATLLPGPVDRLRVEVYLDRFGLGEAYQLGGLQRLSSAEFTDVSANPVARGRARAFLLDRARLYARLLIAVNQYALGDAADLARSVTTMRALLPRLTEPAERAFALLLIGNAEARAGHRAKAERAYRDALAADPGSVRARLGLAELAYLKAGGVFEGRVCTRGTARLAELRALERRYAELAGDIPSGDPQDLRPRAEFALARTRLCLLLARGKAPLGQIERGLLTAAASWENDTRKTWLRTITAESYALLAEIRLLAFTDREPDPAAAARYFAAAARTAPDTARRTAYENRRRDVSRSLPSPGGPA